MSRNASSETQRRNILEEFSNLPKTKNRTSRTEYIMKRFPLIMSIDWVDAFGEEIELFGDVLRDLLREESSTPGRAGPRPNVDETWGRQRLNQMLGRDYTTETFPESFRTLAGDRSIRHLASKTGLNKNTVHKLLNGEKEPDDYSFTQIANSFDKHPSYFLEWRINYVLNFLSSKMTQNPDSTIDIYRRLTQRVK